MSFLSVRRCGSNVYTPDVLLTSVSNASMLSHLRGVAVPTAQGCAPRLGGRLAQLGERCLRKAEVGSSNLLPSICEIKHIRKSPSSDKILKDALRTVSPSLSSTANASAIHDTPHRRSACQSVGLLVPLPQ